MVGRRAAGLLVALALAGCTTQVHGQGEPDRAAAPPSAPATPQVVRTAGDALELTPLSGVRSTTGEAALRIELRVRNVGSTTTSFRPTGAKLTGDAGTQVEVSDVFDPDTPAGDPAHPAFPLDSSLGPGETLVGFLTFSVDTAFHPVTLTYEELSWPVRTLPGQPAGGTVQRPDRAVPAGQPVTLDGTDMTADPSGGHGDVFDAVRLKARVVRMVDPAQGRDAGAGYRLVAAELEIANVGPHPYWAVPPADMTIVDTAGHPYDAVSFLDADQFPNGQIVPGKTRHGLVGFLVPASARLSYVGLALFSGGDAAVGRWAAS